jgi:arylsulfatase A-like enzyme
MATSFSLKKSPVPASSQRPEGAPMNQEKKLDESEDSTDPGHSFKVTRRSFLKAGAAAAAVAAPLFLRARAPGKLRPRNILFIISDEHRFDVAGYRGDPYVATPNIDRLAREGVRFDNHYCQHPLCVPSRMSLITSQYPYVHGTIENVVPYKKSTLIDYLRRSAGFRAYLSGKSHMTTKAFDAVYSHENLDSQLDQNTVDERAMARAEYKAHYKDADALALEINTMYHAYPLREELFEEILFNKLASGMLGEHRRRPFFLWLSFLRPHMPWTPPQRFYAKYKAKSLPAPSPPTQEVLDKLPLLKREETIEKGINRLTQAEIANSVKAYYACVEFMDNCVGMALNMLDSYGLAEETIVVYTSDHGEMLGQHGTFFKRCFYEPSVHVPCIIRFPGHIPSGLVVSRVTESIDLFPTLFDYAGIPRQGTEQGMSLRPLIEHPSNAGWKDEAFAETKGYSDLRRGYMIRSDEWKYCYYPGDREELFDLERDPLESRNLIGEPGHGNVMRLLREKVQRRFGINLLLPKTAAGASRNG